MGPRIDLDAFRLEHWTEAELENVKLVVDFVQHTMNDHDFDYVKQTFREHRYQQHNLSLNDGIPGVVQSVQELIGRFPEFQYDVQYILASGDMVVFHSHAVMRAQDKGKKNTGLLITDRWRVVNGEIVEHWDAIQPLSTFFRFAAFLTGGSIRNNNPLF